MESKICKKCNLNLPFSNFNNHKGTKDKKHIYCKLCKSNKYKIWKKGKEEQLKEYWRTYSKLPKTAKRRRENWNDNRDIKNKYQNEYQKNRRKTDETFRISKNLRSRLYQFLNNKNLKKSKNTEDILGCSFNELKLYLESRFEPWMTWENYGKYNGELDYGWDIDHIIPLNSVYKLDDIMNLFNFKNLQPLCSKVNRDIKWKY